MNSFGRRSGCHPASSGSSWTLPYPPRTASRAATAGIVPRPLEGLGPNRRRSGCEHAPVEDRVVVHRFESQAPNLRDAQVELGAVEGAGRRHDRDPVAGFERGRLDHRSTAPTCARVVHASELLASPFVFKFAFSPAEAGHYVRIVRSVHLQVDRDRGRLQADRANPGTPNREPNAELEHEQRRENVER